MKTYTGRYVDPFNLKKEDIEIRDIAHALSQLCRFNGHTRFHYSVAQHSIYVSQNCGRDQALAGLLHDASEAYLCDVPRPLKHHEKFAFYRELEAEVQGTILTAFGLPPVLSKEVKDADNAMLVTEGIQLMNELFPQFGPPANTMIEKITPGEAEQAFLAEYQAILFRAAGLLAGWKEDKYH